MKRVVKFGLAAYVVTSVYRNARDEREFRRSIIRRFDKIDDVNRRTAAAIGFMKASQQTREELKRATPQTIDPNLIAGLGTIAPLPGVSDNAPPDERMERPSLIGEREQ